MDRECDAVRARGGLDRLKVRSPRHVGVGKGADPTQSGNGFGKDLLPFAVELEGDNRDAGRVAARLGQRLDKALANHVVR